MSTNPEDSLLEAVKNFVPNLSSSKHKGQDGRIGVFGGSLEYTGAPFFAGMSALRTGADLVHVFCCQSASVPIKSYSPELMVHPVLDHSQALSKIEPWLERLNVILIGPGLGRDEEIFRTISELIKVCRKLSKPVIIDADGLFLISQNPDLVKNYPQLILTPNAMEFTRLVKAYLNKDIPPASVVEDSYIKDLAKAIGGDGVTVLRKGSRDAIGGNTSAEVIGCSVSGSGRRCGGQGDLLGGALSVFTTWALRHTSSETVQHQQRSVALACYAACRLTRECNAAAFNLKGRGALASDMLQELPSTFSRLFENRQP
ncbi:hypothetical protein QAD02_024178 [Eretmocerus hayati]|uniref:Uncharacterized protein n=1 Tax=Eretmocerus hayati TaxID=131215 RepID=A0ACC2PZ31_9HYME|nr:hypothetical protein QAD02_024178 [Eretmocerus hayati]